MSKVNFVSLGCDKNLADSEGMLGILLKNGHIVTEDENEAEIFIVNTCCFIQDALQESIDTILSLAEYKNSKCKGIIVTGCIAERYKQEVFNEMPEVDAVVGTASFEKINDALEAILQGEKSVSFFSDINGAFNEEFYIERATQIGKSYAYIKIAEGCDSFCTYCIIPKIKGKYRSRTIESIVKEAEALAQNGVREIILVAQDTALYGKDIYGEKTLPTLLEQLSQVEGIEWIRIMYCYPEHITDELIDVVASNEKVCKYLDVPIQHASDSVLKRMNRKSTNSHLKEILKKLKSKGICMRTTVITGFPGETKEDVQILLSFMDEIKFDRLGVFEYSREEGTPAYDLTEQVSEKVKAARKSRIMEHQKNISDSICRELVGLETNVIIEGKLSNEENIYCARSYRDAPEVDGLVFVNCTRELISGEFVKVKIVGASDYDLIAETV